MLTHKESHDVVIEYIRNFFTEDRPEKESGVAPQRAAALRLPPPTRNTSSTAAGTAVLFGKEWGIAIKHVPPRGRSGKGTSGKALIAWRAVTES